MTVTIPDPEQVESTGGDFRLWKLVHEALPASMRTATMPDGQILSVGCDTLHRVRPAHHRGARVLFRMSMWHHDYLGDGGRVATAQQVYRIIDHETVWVPSESAGW